MYLCERLKYYGVKKLFEPFCGVGGIAVHAAGNFEQFVVNDIDENKIRMLKNNLKVYGKGLNLVGFMNRDAMEVQPFHVDAVLIFPPWGGPIII
jgi:tRNA G10  N-methylase Trm11